MTKEFDAVDRLAFHRRATEVSSMSLDFQHLSPEERIQLAEDLWDSLPDRRPVLSAVQQAELDRRAELHAAEPSRGRPWREVLDEIERRVR